MVWISTYASTNMFSLVAFQLEICLPPSSRKALDPLAELNMPRPISGSPSEPHGWLLGLIELEFDRRSCFQLQYFDLETVGGDCGGASKFFLRKISMSSSVSLGAASTFLECFCFGLTYEFQGNKLVSSYQGT
jgi:hypothetical protein